MDEADGASSDRCVGGSFVQGRITLQPAMGATDVVRRTCLELRTESEARRKPSAVSSGDEIVSRTLGVSSMRALGIRSSYKGRTVDA